MIPKADIIDVAKYFLLKEPLCDIKLQALCYLAEVLSQGLFKQSIAKNAEFEACLTVPQNRRIARMCDRFGIDDVSIKGFNKARIIRRMKKVFTEEQLAILEAVWRLFGGCSGDYITEWIHENDLAWYEANRRGCEVIQAERMQIACHELIWLCSCLLLEA